MALAVTTWRSTLATAAKIVFGLLCASSSIAGQVLMSHPTAWMGTSAADPSLVLWYPLNAPVVDSYYVSAGSVSNSCDQTVISKQPSWDGSHVVFSSAAEQVLTNRQATALSFFTLAAWVQTRTRLTSGNALTILSSYRGYSSLQEGEIKFYLYSGATWTNRIYLYININGTFTNVYGSASLATSEWHHVAASYTGTNLYLYLDGALEGSSFAPLGLLDVPRTFSIGEDNPPGGGQAEYWNGPLSDVRVYNRPLSILEITNLYTTTVTNY
jgi:hypothetical protein